VISHKGGKDSEVVFLPLNDPLHNGIHDGSGFISLLGYGSPVDFLQGARRLDLEERIQCSDLLGTSSDCVQENDPQNVLSARRGGQRALIHGLGGILPLVVEPQQVLEAHLLLVDVSSLDFAVLFFDFVQDCLEELRWTTDVDQDSYHQLRRNHLLALRSRAEQTVIQVQATFQLHFHSSVSQIDGVL